MPLGRFRNFLFYLIEDTTHIPARFFNLFMIALIVLSMTVWVVDTNKQMAAQWGATLQRIEYFCMVVFIVEYVLRALAFRGPLWKFIFSPMSIVDVLAVAPFFLAGSSNTAVLRLLRIFRVFRIFKLARYSEALKRLYYVFRENLGLLGIFSFVVIVILFISAALMHALEPQRFGQMTDALWWSIVTLTTVGYGDLVPETLLGKFIAAVLMLLGIGVIALPTGILGASLTRMMIDEKTWAQSAARVAGKTSTLKKHAFATAAAKNSSEVRICIS
jgi:voltage-gated potassium channel